MHDYNSIVSDVHPPLDEQKNRLLCSKYIYIYIFIITKVWNSCIRQFKFNFHFASEATQATSKYHTIIGFKIVDFIFDFNVWFDLDSIANFIFDFIVNFILMSLLILFLISLLILFLISLLILFLISLLFLFYCYCYAWFHC